MEEWLAQIGLKGRALEIAVKSCEENLVDGLSVLASLEQDKENFKEAFPQAVIRSAISKALASEEHKGEESQVPMPMKAEAKQTDARYFAYLPALRIFLYDLQSQEYRASKDQLGTGAPRRQKVRALSPLFEIFVVIL